ARKDSTAFYAAQAGFSRAQYAIKNSDPALPASCTCATNPSCSGTACTNSPAFTGGNALASGATFTLTITNNAGSSTFPVTAPNGTLVPPGLIFVQSQGNYGGYTKSVYALIDGGSGTSFFKYATLDKQFVKIGNGLIDSYDSTLGP